jgi:hypothetical protein
VVVGDDEGHSSRRLVQSGGIKYKYATRLVRDYVINPEGVRIWTVEAPCFINPNNKIDFFYASVLTLIDV